MQKTGRNWDIPRPPAPKRGLCGTSGIRQKDCVFRELLQKNSIDRDDRPQRGPKVGNGRNHPRPAANFGTNAENPACAGLSDAV